MEVVIVNSNGVWIAWILFHCLTSAVVFIKGKLGYSDKIMLFLPLLNLLQNVHHPQEPKWPKEFISKRVFNVRSISLYFAISSNEFVHGSLWFVVRYSTQRQALLRSNLWLVWWQMEDCWPFCQILLFALRMLFTANNRWVCCLTLWPAVLQSSHLSFSAINNYYCLDRKFFEELKKANTLSSCF